MNQSEDQEISPHAYLQNHVLTPGLANPWALYWWWTLDVTLGENKRLNHGRRRKKNTISHYQWLLIGPYCFPLFAYLCRWEKKIKKNLNRKEYNQARWPCPFISTPCFPVQHKFPRYFHHGLTTSKFQSRCMQQPFTFMCWSWSASWKQWREKVHNRRTGMGGCILLDRAV